MRTVGLSTYNFAKGRLRGLLCSLAYRLLSTQATFYPRASTPALMLHSFHSQLIEFVSKHYGNSFARGTLIRNISAQQTPILSWGQPPGILAVSTVPLRFVLAILLIINLSRKLTSMTQLIS